MPKGGLINRIKPVFKHCLNQGPFKPHSSPFFQGMSFFEEDAVELGAICR